MAAVEMAFHSIPQDGRQSRSIIRAREPQFISVGHKCYRIAVHRKTVDHFGQQQARTVVGIAPLAPVNAALSGDLAGIGPLPEIIFRRGKRFFETDAPLFKILAIDRSNVALGVVGQRHHKAAHKGLGHNLNCAICFPVLALHELHDAEVGGIADRGHEAGFRRCKVCRNRRQRGDRDRSVHKLRQYGWAHFAAGTAVVGVDVAQKNRALAVPHLERKLACNLLDVLDPGLL